MSNDSFIMAGITSNVLCDKSKNGLSHIADRRKIYVGITSMRIYSGVNY